MTAFSASSFPRPKAGFIKAKLAPVVYSPLAGAIEKFLVAAVVYHETGNYFLKANNLERLACLYGPRASDLVFVLDVALDDLGEKISSLSPEVLTDARSGMLGLQFAEAQNVEGVSLQEIATSWLSGMSSFHSRPADPAVQLPAELEHNVINYVPRVERSSQRLGKLISAYVVQRRPALGRAFAVDVRSAAKKKKASAHYVYIDFSGSNLVANFGMITPKSYGQSIDRVKRRMWDLKIDRDKQQHTFLTARHEMLVQHPSEYDPQLSQQQIDRVMEGVQELTKRADQQEIHLRPMTTVYEIGDYLITQEAA